MNSHLLAFDFDGTVARTFDPSPQGIGVHEAYSLAINDILGPEGIKIYQSLNGLKNRAPKELTHLLLDTGSPAMLDHTYGFFNENRGKLNGFIPPDKAVPLVWDSANPQSIIPELLVRQKLSYLLDQIGTQFPDGRIWPQPCTGFMDFWKKIHGLKEQDVGLSTAIISSGHQTFIEKFFDTWGLQPPDILITEDDIRGKKYPRELERRVKPGQRPLALTHLAWLKSLGIDSFDLPMARDVRSRMAYFGDDPVKDGQLASGNVVFGLFNENENAGRTCTIPNSFTFTDWTIVARQLQENTTNLREGKPFKDIFLENNHSLESISFTHSAERI